MSLTHLDLAGLVSSLYGYQGSNRVDWLYLANADAMAVFGIVRIDDYLIVVYRGSYTGRDWLLDVLVKDTDPIGRPSIQNVHRGFYTGTPEASDIIMMFYREGDKIIIIGHSLGAARCEIEAEHLVAAGITPHLVVTWGQPAPFKPSPMPGPKYPFVKYRNMDSEEDPVTYSTDIAGYRHRTPFIDVHAPPANPKWWDPFDLHHFELYQSVTPQTPVP